MARTGTPPREKARVYRTGRPDRLSPLLFAVAALILCAGIGAVLWHEWQGTRPTAAEQAEADEIEQADGGEAEIAAVTEEAADGKIVVAIDPGHGGVNPSVGGEDAGSLGSGLREADVTLKTATLVYDKLARDGRFAPMLTANGTEYLKPSRRAARAEAAGAQLLLSIHLNYDADSRVSGFECCPATPQLSTNATACALRGWSRKNSVQWGWSCAASTACATSILTTTTTVTYASPTTRQRSPTRRLPWCRNAAARRCWWRRASSQTPATLPWSPPTQPARRRHRRTMNVS